MSKTLNDVVNRYTWALDLSMSNTGVGIFNEYGECVFVTSIATRTKDSTPRRLFDIYSAFTSLDNTYPCERIIIERAFSRFNNATQALFRVHGVVNCMFWDREQIYYPPKVIKQTLIGGKATKAQIGVWVKEHYANVTPTNDDETDAIAIGACYFIKRNGKSENDETTKTIDASG